MEMKPSFTIWVLAGTLLLAACTPVPTPALDSPPSIDPSAAPDLVPETEAPALVSLDLAGPSGGTSMRWADGSNLVYVPAGDFQMGDSSIPDAPQTSVYLDGYWISLTEVTNRMYVGCVSLGACAPPAPELGTPSFDNPEYGNYPVVGISWDMAANYCGWAGGSLPTEAQWEKAARGIVGNPYPWGTGSPNCSLANLAGCVSAINSVIVYQDGTSPFGALDMVGNVFEWVADWYGSNYYGSVLQNPSGPERGEFRVIRGSGFESTLDQAMIAIRHYGNNAYHNRDLGFRCVIEYPKALAPYCQLNPFVPLVTTDGCGAPETTVYDSYCESKQSYATVDLPMNVGYAVMTPGFSCSEAVIDGQRRLTCAGPDEVSGQISICDPACTGGGSVAGQPVCDLAYLLAGEGNQCSYTPVETLLEGADCRSGFIPALYGDQQVCLPDVNVDGFCPSGMYFDTLAGGCVPASGAFVPYGQADSSGAQGAFRGCLPGYAYDANGQCCQSGSDGADLACPLGMRFDRDQGTCIRDDAGVLEIPGCVIVTVHMLDCVEDVNVCAGITEETTCIRTTGCAWDDRNNICTKE
jgi:formylglycine-generating enzyme required for sulfatase activity